MSTTELILLGGLMMNAMATYVLVSRSNATLLERMTRIETLVELIVNKRIKTKDTDANEFIPSERPLY